MWPFKKKKQEPAQQEVNTGSPQQKSPQQIAAETNFQFRIVFDEYRAGKLTQEQMNKAFALLLKEHVHPLYYARVTAILYDTTGIPDAEKPAFNTATDYAGHKFIFGAMI